MNGLIPSGKTSPYRLKESNLFHIGKSSLRKTATASSFPPDF